MSFHSQLIALSFVFGCQLTASTIDLTATTATASWTGPGSFGSVEFTITGPSLIVQGQAIYGLPLFFPTGASLAENCNGCQFDLEETRGAPLVPGCGVAGIAGGSCSGSGDVFIPIPIDVLMPETPNPTFTFPATLTGGYDLCAQSVVGPCSPGAPDTPIAAHISVDLTGELTLSFKGPYPPQVPPGPQGPPYEFDVLQGAQFISTPIPESSSFILMLISLVGVALAATLRYRFISRRRD